MIMDWFVRPIVSRASSTRSGQHAAVGVPDVVVEARCEASSPRWQPAAQSPLRARHNPLSGKRVVVHSHALRVETGTTQRIGWRGSNSLERVSPSGSSGGYETRTPEGVNPTRFSKDAGGRPSWSDPVHSRLARADRDSRGLCRTGTTETETETVLRTGRADQGVDLCGRFECDAAPIVLTPWLPRIATATRSLPVGGVSRPAGNDPVTSAPGGVLEMALSSTGPDPVMRSHGRQRADGGDSPPGVGGWRSRCNRTWTVSPNIQAECGSGWKLLLTLQPDCYLPTRHPSERRPWLEVRLELPTEVAYDLGLWILTASPTAGSGRSLRSQVASTRSGTSSLHASRGRCH